MRHAKRQGEATESKYLFEVPLGRITFKSDREPVEIVGLYDYLSCQRRYVERWTEEVPWRHGGNNVVEHRETYTVPLEVSRRAFRTINEFLEEEHDLELQFEELEDQTPYHDFREEYDDGVHR
jgi:hypothetical protein